MVKKLKKNSSKESALAKLITTALVQIVKAPYYFVRGIVWLARETDKKTEEHKLKRYREPLPARYSKFKILKTSSGNYSSWENKVFNADSTIGIILGARGSGKSAFGMRVLENLHTKSKRPLYALGFQHESLPAWINVVNSIEELPKDCFVLIDEGGILFSSRAAMSKPNKLLSDLLLISRHKSISILFISQNSSNLEINALRQADYLVLKPSSLLQKEFERKIIQNLYEKTQSQFEKFNQDQGLAYIHSSEFEGYVSNPLPSFWSGKLSKSFR